MTKALQDRFFVLVLLAAPVAACGQPPASAPDADALSGPKVVDKAKTQNQPTLMQPSFDGGTEELSERPEVALLRQLTLTDKEKAATDKLLAERTIKVSKLLAENLEEFLALQSLLQEVAGGGSLYSPPPAEQDDQRGMNDGERPAEQRLREKMFALREKAKDLIEPPLVDQIAAHLTSEHGTKLRDAVMEYYRANPAPGRVRAGAGANQRIARSELPQTPRAAARRETQQLLRELGRALRVIVEERQEKFDELVQTVGPTPEQEAKIQAILRDQGAAGQLKPTPAQRTESFRKIMDVLTPAQRQKLREVLAR
jgi:hypothetical protein